MKQKYNRALEKEGSVISVTDEDGRMDGQNGVF